MVKLSNSDGETNLTGENKEIMRHSLLSKQRKHVLSQDPNKQNLSCVGAKSFALNSNSKILKFADQLPTEVNLKDISKNVEPSFTAPPLLQNFGEHGRLSADHVAT